MTDLANKVKSLVRNVPNFPKKGIVFKDITPVLADGTTFTRTVGALEAYGRKQGTELVAGIESRGFLFGAAVAARVLATGGTLVGACKLVEKVGGVVAGSTCVIELAFLNGLKKLKGRDFYSVVQYSLS